MALRQNMMDAMDATYTRMFRKKSNSGPLKSQQIIFFLMTTHGVKGELDGPL